MLPLVEAKGCFCNQSFCDSHFRRCHTINFSLVVAMFVLHICEEICMFFVRSLFVVKLRSTCWRFGVTSILVRRIKFGSIAFILGGQSGIDLVWCWFKIGLWDRFGLVLESVWGLVLHRFGSRNGMCMYEVGPTRRSKCVYIRASTSSSLRLRSSGLHWLQFTGWQQRTQGRKVGRQEV